jgi:hypothetical protein
MDELVGSVPVGNRVYTERLFNDILRALNEIENIGYKVERVTVRSRDEIVFDIEHNGNILFSDRKPFDVSLDNFKASLHSNALSSSTQFEYIDVRFGNKVFYKIDVSQASTSQNTVHASSSKKR